MRIQSPSTTAVQHFHPFAQSESYSHDWPLSSNYGRNTGNTETLDDYISEENPVRVIDVFVDELDLSGMGFEIIPADTGRSSYHPSIMLKLYIYGYLNRIQSSRRLEKETQRNVEMMWLTERLMPDHKTIANFRKDYGAPIRKASSEFIVLCRRTHPAYSYSKSA